MEDNDFCCVSVMTGIGGCEVHRPNTQLLELNGLTLICEATASYMLDPKRIKGDNASKVSVPCPACSKHVLMLDTIIIISHVTWEESKRDNFDH